MTGGDAGTRSSSAGLRRVQPTRQEACTVGYTSAVLRSKPLLQKAEATLNGMVAEDDQAT